MSLLDGMGHGYSIDIEGPYEDKLMKIFQDERGEKLLDGVTDPVKK